MPSQLTLLVRVVPTVAGAYMRTPVSVLKAYMEALADGLQRMEALADGLQRFVHWTSCPSTVGGNVRVNADGMGRVKLLP